jgi:hypothetical protein
MKSSQTGATYNLIGKVPVVGHGNPRGLHLSKVFEKDRKFNTAHDKVEILSGCLNGAQFKQGIISIF